MSRLSAFGISQLSQFHENPRLIAWWHKHLFYFLRWFSFDKRRAILAAGALWAAVKIIHSGVQDLKDQAIDIDTADKIIVYCVILLFLWMVYAVAIKFARLPQIIKRHPLYALHMFYWGLLIALWHFGRHDSTWWYVLLAFTVSFPYLIWRCSYLLLSGQQGRAVKSRFSDQLLCLLPIYGGTNTPYGKGFDYLSKFEARDELTLAKSQLAALKLFLLSKIWRALQKLIEALIYGPANELTTKLGGFTLGISPLSEQIAATGQYSIFESWLSIYLELFIQVLDLAAYGLIVVGFLRFFGFNVFRNTYKPLLAESIVEFWNRYYYYFKELLSNFFFIPTFMQLGGLLKRRPTIRLFIAVFAAAFVGNIYYHMIQNPVALVLYGADDILYGMRSRAFYCFLLAIGIFISMLREQKRASQQLSEQRRMRYARIFGVWTFYGLIYIWNVRGDSSIDFMQRTRFFMHLFGI